MTTRRVLLWPDTILSQKSIPVYTIDAEVRTLVDDMWETMHRYSGAGLAAIQVGIPLQVIVIDVKYADEKAEPRAYINPTFDPVPNADGKIEMEWGVEGCLSVPGVTGKVERFKTIKAKFQDLDGTWHEEVMEGVLSTAYQHEQEHTMGIVYVSHLSHLKQSMIKSKMLKLGKKITRYQQAQEQFLRERPAPSQATSAATQTVDIPVQPVVS